MWAKWKTGLETASVEAPVEPSPPATSTSVATTPRTSGTASKTPATPRTPPSPRSAPRPVVPRFDANRAAQSARPAARIGGSAAAEAPDESIKLQEKQREQQRFQLIKTSVQNAGMIWGFGVAAVIFIVGCVILFVLDNALKPPPFHLSRPIFDLFGFFIVLIVAALGGLIARKKAKRRAVAELSLLTLEELARRGR
jgi:hypothetical protein